MIDAYSFGSIAVETYQTDGLRITLNRKGADRYRKISCPLPYGVYSEIRTASHTFEFNLNGEIKTIRGLGRGWLDASEWLKRSTGDDWVYFSAGGYNGAYDFTGEYYVPCLSYESNGVFGNDRFGSEEVADAFHAWQRLRARLKTLNTSLLPEGSADFIRRVVEMAPEALKDRARRFHGILRGEISVLPPDTRHVEYDVIPVIIADGCLYNCGFCRVKSGRPFRQRSEENILGQIQQLKAFYGADLINYNAVFLGNHDGLHADPARIELAAIKAYEVFELERSALKTPRLFLFGSVDSILRAADSLFAMLNRLPYETYINIGLESADAETLALLKKPVEAEKVRAAFDRMMAVNRRYAGLEVTANFVCGADLPGTHLPSILELTRNRLDHACSKGACYLSPLENIGSKQEFLNRFAEFKTLCRLPAYLYLIQRL
jgi:hypothetical protein